MAPGTFAEQLYTAYGEDADWLDYRGRDMPPWEHLPEPERDHWAAVAREAARLLI